jgi:hypothetical protein
MVKVLGAYLIQVKLRKILETNSGEAMVKVLGSYSVKAMVKYWEDTVFR